MFDGLPGWLVLVIFSLVSAGVAVALHAAFRRLVPPEDLLPHHDVAGFLVSIVGVLYAVVLGFLVINVWASFDLAQRNADAETNDLSTILHLAKAFPEPARSQTQRLIARYAFEVRDREWPMLSHGEEDTQARAIMFDAFNVVATMQPAQKASPAEDLQLASLRDAALSTFRDLTAHRRERVLDAESHLAAPLYFALIAGAVILMAFVFLFGVKNRVLQLAMTGLVAAMIGLQIGVVYELDRPFWGALQVQPHAWDVLIRDNHLHV